MRLYGKFLRVLSTLTVICVMITACGGDREESGTSISGDGQRLRELEEMLADSPTGFGRPVQDRAAWQHIASLPAFANAVESAEKLIGEAVPELPDTLFLEFSRNGNRSNYQTPQSRRRTVLSQLVIGECIENNGRFVSDIERFIKSICSEKTWVLPAHDRSLDNFYGRTIQIDLRVATTSWFLATADYLLGDKLDPEVRKLIRDEVQRRTFDPFLRMVRGEEELIWWMTERNEQLEQRLYRRCCGCRYGTYRFTRKTVHGFCSEQNGMPPIICSALPMTVIVPRGLATGTTDSAITSCLPKRSGWRPAEKWTS